MNLPSIDCCQCYYVICRRLPRWVLAVAVLVLPASHHAAAFSIDDSLKRLRVSPVAPGQAASPFELISLDERHVKLNDFAGKVLVVNFWATWCGPCKEEMPAFERLRRQVDPEHIAVMTITTDLQRTAIKQFLGALDVHLPVLFDEDHEVSRAYMVRALPTTVLVSRQGTLIGRAVGPRDWDSPEAIVLIRQLVERGH
jgi:thiol-disulfide isomerase/thioredoxin